MSKSTEFLYFLKSSIENKNFESTSDYYFGSRIVCSNKKTKNVSKTIAEIYNTYLIQLKQNEILNNDIILKIHKKLELSLKSKVFKRDATMNYYKYIIDLINSFLSQSKATNQASLFKKCFQAKPITDPFKKCSPKFEGRSVNVRNQFELNFNFEDLLNRYEEDIKYQKKLSIIDPLIEKSKKWKTALTLLDDAMAEKYNFAIPERLTLEQIEKFNRSTFYRFVINIFGIIIFGIIIFGHDNNIYDQERNEIMSFNGIKVASHAALNDYEDVISAGEVFFVAPEKQFSIINNCSGHYKTDNNSIRLA